LINRAPYTDLVEAGTIDIAISPQQVTIGSLLRYVRRGDVVRVHTLRRGAAGGDRGDRARESRRARRSSGGASRTSSCRKARPFAAIVRNDEVIMAHHDTVVHADDHVILFVTDRTARRAVEKLFEGRSDLRDEQPSGARGRPARAAGVAAGPGEA
jgi:trk system potassium uptake protein TrkA